MLTALRSLHVVSAQLTCSLFAIFLDSSCAIFKNTVSSSRSANMIYMNTSFVRIQVAQPFPAHCPLGTTLNESSAWLGTEWEGFLMKIIVSLYIYVCMYVM